MKIEPQAHAGLVHIAALIEDIPIAMLTTRDGHGALASRPMAALEMDAGGAIWFFTDLRSAKIEQLRAANLCFTDQSKGTYVSLSGRGEIDSDRLRIRGLWTPFAKPWFPDGPESPNLGLLKFTPDAADYWDGPASSMVRGFSVVASLLVGRPVGMGEQGSLTGLSPGATAAGVGS